MSTCETGTYQYHTDSFGNRCYKEENFWWWWSESYKTRDSILEFIRKEQSSDYFHSGNEVMVKERLAPSFFKCLVVSNEATKSELVSYLEGCGLVQNNTILNKAIDQFIRIGTYLTTDLIS